MRVLQNFKSLFYTYFRGREFTNRSGLAQSPAIVWRGKQVQCTEQSVRPGLEAVCDAGSVHADAGGNRQRGDLRDTWGSPYPFLDVAVARVVLRI